MKANPLILPSLIKAIKDEDRGVRCTAILIVGILVNAARQIRQNKNNLSQAELEKAISDLETALKTIENSQHEIPLHIFSSLQGVIAELKIQQNIK